GSLIWNNEKLKPVEIIDAKLIGAHRSFNKKSTQSRGTKNKPGLALGLEYGSECQGKAIKIPENYLPDLIEREKGYLMIQTPNDSLKVIDSKNQIIDCIVFFPDSKSPNFLNNKVTVEEKAKIIIQSEQGVNGNSREYLKETYKFLKSLDIEDENVTKLYSLVFNK